MRARNLLPSVLGLFALLAGGQALAIGEDDYLQPEDAFNSTATADEQTVTIEWREFGVLVSCTPTVREDSTISLKVTTEVSQVDNSNPLTLTGFVVPSLITRKASTTVEMKRGEYLAIGGLKQRHELRVVNRVPILGHIPLLGFFFRSTRTEEVSSELLVLVQPDFASPSAGALPDGPAARVEQ